MRQPHERRADLRAQLAANRVGCERLTALSGALGAEGLRAATDAVLDYCERRTRACLAAMTDGVRTAATYWRRIHGTCDCELRAQVEGIGSCSTSAAAPSSTTGTSTARWP